MISYYKHTSGEAFTVDGSDYIGYFNVSAHNAYSGKIIDSNSVLLTPKSNFISEVYLNRYEFDGIPLPLSAFASYTPNYFDIFNKKGLSNALEQVDRTNVLIYKNLYAVNPVIFDLKKNHGFFYGLSSTNADSRNDDILMGKNVYTHIDPFEFDSEWNFLDDIKMGTFFVNTQDTFNYICFDSNNTQYTLSGSFSNPETLLTLLPNNSLVSPRNVIFDDIDNTLFFITDTDINIYNATDYAICGTLSISDSIPLDEGIDVDLIRLGYQLRIEVLSGHILNYKNKYTNDLFFTVDINHYNLGEILDLAVRNTDDYTVILSKITIPDYYDEFGNYIPISYEIKLSFFDIQDFDNTFRTYIINDLSPISLKYKVLFSSLDSNLIYVASGEQLQLRLISNPSFYVARLDPNNLLYLYDYIFNTTFERFDQIQIKFNSNKLLSNSFNNLTFDIKTINNTSYLLLHNIGRIYVIKQPPINSYITSTDPNLPKYFQNITCSESSFGLYFNNAISNIIRDTLNIFASCSKKISIVNGSIVVKQLEDLVVEIENFYMAGNETINVLTIQRIFLLLSDLQRQLVITN